MPYNSYTELEALPAEAYLNWEDFRTPFDNCQALAEKRYDETQYQLGLDTGHKAKVIHLSVRGVWSAELKNGAHVSSYEGIGYHSGTAALLHGFLDSGAPIMVHRYTETGLSHTLIKGELDPEVAHA